MRPLVTAVLKTGLVPTEALTELQRWGLPVEFADEKNAEPINDLNQVVNIIRDALESGEQVRLQDTDLDVLKRFLDPESLQQGRLTVKDDESRSTFKVVFCITPMGDYIIPWKSEGVRDMIIDGEGVLRYEEGAEKREVHFVAVRDLFFGDHRAFMVCSPAERSNAD
jgi:hypothetical protein